MAIGYVNPILSASRSTIQSYHVSFVNKRVISSIGSKYYTGTSYSDLGSKYVSFLRNNKSRYPSAYSSIGFKRRP